MNIPFICVNIVSENGFNTHPLVEMLEDDDSCHVVWTSQDVSQEIPSDIVESIMEGASPEKRRYINMLIVSFLESRITVSEKVEYVNFERLKTYINENPKVDLVFRREEDGEILMLYSDECYSLATARLFKEATGIDFPMLKPLEDSATECKFIVDPLMFSQPEIQE